MQTQLASQTEAWGKAEGLVARSLGVRDASDRTSRVSKADFGALFSSGEVKATLNRLVGVELPAPAEEEESVVQVEVHGGHCHVARRAL